MQPSTCIYPRPFMGLAVQLQFILAISQLVVRGDDKLTVCFKLLAFVLAGIALVVSAF